jgi:vacuolar-type H+-ATPase subunit I/STV1
MFKYSFRIIFIVLLSSTVWADFKDSGEALVKLKSYESNFFAKINAEATAEEEVAKSPSMDPSEAELKKIDALFDDLESSVKFLQSQKVMDETLLDELVRVANLSLNNDKTRYAAEVVLPVYQKDSKAFKKALKNLPKADAKYFEKSLKNSEREMKKGNG